MPLQNGRTIKTDWIEKCKIVAICLGGCAIEIAAKDNPLNSINYGKRWTMCVYYIGVYAKLKTKESRF